MDQPLHRRAGINMNQMRVWGIMPFSMPCPFKPIKPICLIFLLAAHAISILVLINATNISHYVTNRSPLFCKLLVSQYGCKFDCVICEWRLCLNYCLQSCRLAKWGVHCTYAPHSEKLVNKHSAINQGLVGVSIFYHFYFDRRLLI